MQNMQNKKKECENTHKSDHKNTSNNPPGYE